MLGVANVALRLDSCWVLLSAHVTECLLFTKHPLLILRNLLLVPRDVVPVYKASSLVHAGLVQTLMLLNRVSHDNLAHHDVRRCLVPVVE